GDYDQALSILDQVSQEFNNPATASHIRLQAALVALNKDDVETAYHYAKDITSLWEHALAFGQMAVKLARKGDLICAREMLTEAEKSLSKADDSNWDKMRAVLELAAAAVQADVSRGFEITKTAVETLNHIKLNISY